MEIGADSIKAIRLERTGDDVRVTDFAVIPHKRVLTTPDLDQDEMIRLGLGQFISQKAIEGDRLVMSVPGHAAFARFAKLPPVEPKKVPDIVKFEAVQQIPFPIDQVEWDYQTFVAPDSPEVEVGIFAITRERVSQRLSLYAELGIQPEILSLSPVAVYNAMAFDLGLAGNHKPLVFMDIGTSATDLIVADQGRCWIRTFPLGGTHFTDAVTEAFKLSYSKADKLKQESATSKYAKQIMQAMRPVFSDLLQEVQRSLGYYQTLHRETTLDTIVGLGSTFKIPGLRKFLGQQLQMDVLRLDEFKRIRVEGRDAAEFSAAAVNMATAYGLALQGVGLAPIAVNLAPVDSLREQLWRGKTKWFAAAAGIAVAAAGLMFVGPYRDHASLRPGGVDPVVEDVTRRGQTLKTQAAGVEQSASLGLEIGGFRAMLLDRRVWPALVEDAVLALRSTNPQAPLIADDVDAILAIPAGERRLVSLQRLDGTYNGFAGERRRIDVTMEVEFSHADREVFLNTTVARWLRDEGSKVRDGVPFRVLPESVTINPGRMVTTRVADPSDPSGSAGAGGGAGRPGGRPAGDEDPDRPRGRPTAPAGDGFGGGGGGGRGGGGLEGGGVPRRGLEDGLIAPPDFGPGAPPGGRGTDLGGVDVPPRDGAPPGRGLEPPPDPRGPAEERILDLNANAPIPEPPLLYRPGDQVHRALITFTVELLQPGPAPTSGGEGIQGGSPA
ncbi:MAG TPA: type IV pilus assembly protein PilM [Phycisphaerales bacterium]|nr:type IV pilus assembly protein PilM [Phycisphaerales bacterium]HMP38657.1 type IV pilus assembly protein PilM [Phycisphaerales bacterium]